MCQSLGWGTHGWGGLGAVGAARRCFICLEGQKPRYTHGLGIFMAPGPRASRKP